MENPKHFKVVMQGDAVVARLELARILEDNKVLELGQDLKAIIAALTNEKLIVDFKNVQYISSSALGKLIMAHKQARQQGCRLLFCNLQPTVFGVLVTTRLNELFEIHADEAAALAAS